MRRKLNLEAVRVEPESFLTTLSFGDDRKDRAMGGNFIPGFANFNGGAHRKTEV